MFGPSRFLLASIVSLGLILLGASQCPLAIADDSATNEADLQRFTNSQPKVTVIRSNQTDVPSVSQKVWPWEYVFDKPAHVAWLGFVRDEIAIERDSLVIHDGMIVRVDRNGHFDVRFRMEAPLTQISLRLELNIWHGAHHKGKITLPPIRIQPERIDDPDASSQSFLVEYSGTSEVLRRLGTQVLKQVEEQKLSEANASQAAFQKYQKEVADQLASAIKRQAAAEKEQAEADWNFWEIALQPLWDHESELKAADLRLSQAEANLTKAVEQFHYWKAAKADADAKLAHADSVVAEASNIKNWSLADNCGITFSRIGTARFGGVPR